MRHSRARILLGGAIWLAALAGVGALIQAHAEPVKQPLGRIERFLLAPTREVVAELPGPLRVGDPLLDGERRPVGRVVELYAGEVPVAATWYEGVPELPRYRVVIHLDPEAPDLPPGAELRSGWARGDGRWVYENLLTAEKQALIADELRSFLHDHEQDVNAFVRPVAEEVVAHAMKVLEDNLSAAIEARREQIQQLVDSHRDSVRQELVPVLKARLGPTAKAKADPILREIGRELWNELPMWSLGWNAFLDTIPGTDKNRVDRWWREFVDNKALPILAAHEQDLMRALEELIDEGARDPEVRRALAVASRRLANDPRFKAIVRGVLEDALVRPFDLKGLVDRIMADPHHRARFDRLQQVAGPRLQRIGRLITTDPETGGIDPDLARVLRRVVFRKDVSWVEVVPPDGSTPPAPAGQAGS